MEEYKKFIGWLGIEGDTFDELKNNFTPKYYTEEQAKEKLVTPYLGKKLTKYQQDILNRAREEGIEFTQSEFDGKMLPDVAFGLIGKIRSQAEAERKQLEGKIGQGSDEALKEWKEKYEKAASRAADQEKMNKQLAEQFEGFKKTASEQVKAVKVDYMKSDLFGKLKYKPGIDELTKKGYTAHIEDNYRFGFDDQGQSFVTDKNGERIPSPSKAGTFKTPEEVVQEEAAKFKILAENPQAGKPAAPMFPGMPAAQPNTTQQGAHPFAPGVNSAKRKVSPEMDKYL